MTTNPAVPSSKKLTDSDACLFVLNEVFGCGLAASKARKKNKINIPTDLLVPDTLIYEDGAPKKWIHYNEDRDLTEFSLLDVNDPKALLNAVLSINRIFKKCLVWYVSGGCEELSVSYLFEVFSSAEWQRQIICIQAYIDPEREDNLVTLDYPLFLTECQSNHRKLGEVAVQWMQEWGTQRIDSLIWSFTQDRKTKRRLWLRFVDTVRYTPKRPPGQPIELSVSTASTQQSSTVDTLTTDSTISSSSVSVSSVPKSTLDEDFEQYYTVYCTPLETPVLDVVVVLDCLQEPNDSVENLCQDCSKDGIRIVAVSLVKKGSNPRVAARPPSNVLLSNWLRKLLSSLNIGSDSSSQNWVLAGVGVGANVAFHLAAYRQVHNLQGVISINGFAFVDRTLNRHLRTLDEAISPQAKQILSNIRNGFLDLRSCLNIIKAPMVVIQSTANEIVLPLHVEAIVNARNAPRSICSSLNECLRHQNQVKSHVIWLKAPHDVISDRYDYMRDLISQVHHALMIVNRKHLSFGEEEEEKEDEPQLQRGNTPLEEQLEQDDNDGSQLSSSTSEDEEEEEKKRVGFGTSLFNAVKKNTPKIRRNKKKKKKKERDALELAKEKEEEEQRMLLLQQEEEKRKYVEEQKRRLQEIKELKRIEFMKNKPDEAEERSMMMDEDLFSRELRRCNREEERWAAQQELVKARMEELRAARQRNDDRTRTYAEKERERRRALEYERKKYNQNDGDKDEDITEEEELNSAAMNLLGSSVSGASKIRLDFLKVAQRQAMNIERSKYILELIRKTQTSRDSTAKRVSELERAISMLKVSAHVKNPNQASRKKKRAAEQAARELVDVTAARDQANSLVNAYIMKLKELNHEIAKVNSSIQSDSIIISKKANEMEDMVTKIQKLLSDLGKENDSLIKQRASAVKQQNQLAAMRDSVQHRLDQVSGELDRCQNVRTKFCDSSIWQSGVLQRVRTIDLLTYLEKEGESLKARLIHLERSLTIQAGIIKRSDSRTASLHREKSALTGQLRLLSGGLDLHKSGEIKKRAETDFVVHDTQENDKPRKEKSNKPKEEGEGNNSASEIDDDADGDFAFNNDHSLAASIRHKPSNIRTREEREWVALDMVINRFSDYYTPSQMKNYQHYRPDELTNEIIDCLYELPQEINLALPFIRTKGQLEAFRLIQKYSFGNGLNEPMRLDRLEAAKRRRGLPKFRIFDSIEHFKLTLQEEGKKVEDVDKSSILLTDETWKRMYKVEEQNLHSKEGRIHTFHIPNDMIVQQLVVTIVYEGGFDERGYVMGRLSAAMYFEETTPIGYCSSKHDFSLCSQETMGRFTLVHDPNQAGCPISSGRYQIVVGAASLTRYSITILAQTCQPLAVVEQRSKQEALEIMERLNQIEQDKEDLTIGMYLSERKVSLIENLVREAEEKCSEVELKMARVSNVLERKRRRLETGFYDADDDPDDSDDEEIKKCTPALLVKIEMELDKWVHRASSRRTELHDTRVGTGEMARLKREFKEEFETKTERLETLKHHNIISEQDIVEVRKQKEAEAKEKLEREKQEQHERREEFFASQPNAAECWDSIHKVLYPTPKKSKNKNHDLLTREELLAVLCSDPQSLTHPQTKALQQLLLEKCPPLEKKCIAEPMLVEPRMLRKKKVDFEAEVPIVVTDIDQKCRNVLAELEKANASNGPFFDSSILHGSTQRFPIKVLRKELNRELDRLLVLQVREQEVFMLKQLRKKYQANADAQALLVYDDSSEEEDDNNDENNDEGKKEDVFDQLTEDPSSSTHGHCKACNFKPCQWKPPIDPIATQERILELHEELEMVRHIDDSVRFVESKVAKSVKLGGKPRMLRTDLLSELQTELSHLDRKRRLHLVDDELHRGYNCRDQFMETVALHGYKQVQWTSNVINSLEAERERLIGAEVASDLIDGILEHMLIGWVFGEREIDVEQKLLEGQQASLSGSDNEPRVQPTQKWLAISKNLVDRKRKKAAVQLKKDVGHQLNETENVLQFGLFSMTLMYFRAMTLLKKSKFDGAEDGKKKRIKAVASQAASERQRMDRSKIRAQARKRALDRAMGKALAGERRKEGIVEQKKREKTEKLRKIVRKAHLEGKASIEIQRVFRGHLGRMAAVKWAMVRLELIAQENLEYAAAVAIQRIFRGYVGRSIAEDKKNELAEFIAQVRAEEAREEEAEYWRRNPVKRFIRDAKRMFKSTPPPSLDELDDVLVKPEDPRNF